MSEQTMKKPNDVSNEEIRARGVQEAEKNRRQARTKLAISFIVPIIILSIIVTLSYKGIINDTVSYLMIIPMLAVGAFSVSMVFQHFTHYDNYQQLRKRTKSLD